MRIDRIRRMIRQAVEKVGSENLCLDQPRGDLGETFLFVAGAGVGSVDLAHVVRPVCAELPVIAGFRNHQPERPGFTERPATNAQKWTLH